MNRTGGRLTLVAAALIGYLAGTWNSGSVVNAARDPAKELLDADRQFDTDTAANGIDGWVVHFAPDGIMMPQNHDMVVGQDAVRSFMSKAFATPGFTLRWEPIDAAVSGDIGYTYGVSKITRTGSDGKPATSYGKYVTIWRRSHNRPWEIVMDIGNASPAPAKETKAQ